MKKKDEYLEIDHLRILDSFIKGEINFKRYYEKRGLTPRIELAEIKHIINTNPRAFNAYLAKLSIGARCIAMKTLYELTDRQITSLSYELSETYNSKSSIGTFIKNRLKNWEDNKSILTSINFVYDLSIIFDLPFLSLLDPDSL